MTATVQTRASAPADPVRRRPLVDAALVVGVLVGAALFVATAYAQPYNQNELQQISTYGSNDLGVITGATRQPPLGPLVGAFFRHLIGTGQLVQRLVPVLSGIGTLALMGLTLRRLRLGWAAVFAVWFMAVAPLMMRYSAYTRPYALPVFLMMVLVYGAVRWFDGYRARWLVVVFLGAFLLPLARVPEPVIYLGSTAVVLAFLTLRGRWAWRRSGPVIGLCLAALVCVGYPMYHSLVRATAGHPLYDPSPSGIAHRFGDGVHEIVTFLIPLLGDLFPWWPLTVLTIIAAVAVPASRKRIGQWWFFWPLLLAPVGFALAYHFLNAVPFDVRPYRPRMAYFFVPPYIVLVAALAAAVAEADALGRRLRIGLAVLLAATLVGQLPWTVKTLTENDAIDYGQAADVLTHDLPRDSVVLYDTLSPVGRWRQPFQGRPRYMGKKPYVAQVSHRDTIRHLPRHGPVYILLLDSACASTVVCDAVPSPWNGHIRGWTVKQRFDRFTLYQPVQPRNGRRGAAKALEQMAHEIGPEYGYPEYRGAATLWRHLGRRQHARDLIKQMYAAAAPAVRSGLVSEFGPPPQ